MNLYLLIAAVMALLLGIVHSVLGEMIILRHLSKVEGFPPIFNNQLLPKWTIRISWHIATMLGWGMAAVLIHFSRLNSLTSDDIFTIRVLAMIFFAAAIISIVGARARHPSWLAFLVIGILCLIASFK